MNIKNKKIAALLVFAVVSGTIVCSQGNLSGRKRSNNVTWRPEESVRDFSKNDPSDAIPKESSHRPSKQPTEHATTSESSDDKELQELLGASSNLSAGGDATLERRLGLSSIAGQSGVSTEGFISRFCSWVMSFWQRTPSVPVVIDSTGDVPLVPRPNNSGYTSDGEGTTTIVKPGDRNFGTLSRAALSRPKRSVQHTLQWTFFAGLVSWFSWNFFLDGVQRYTITKSLGLQKLLVHKPRR